MSTINQDALKYILSMPRGRQVLRDILGFAGLFRQPLVPGDHDLSFMNAGQLNVALMIYADCGEASPQLTAMMLQETSYADGHSADTSPSALAERVESDAERLERFERDPNSLGFDRLGNAE